MADLNIGDPLRIALVNVLFGFSDPENENSMTDPNPYEPPADVIGPAEHSDTSRSDPRLLVIVATVAPWVPMAALLTVIAIALVRVFG